ncbi:hypothetical protein OUY22_35355 [Nonomuraea sp. MCN248]|uniref:Metalloprotease n=1 Tax=Nonomuraea corallina TaxID=2989783 RepID=A0ABT4SNA8_9ACTN|nr:hypothetical protein [Nonomuraea corallina]MDA0638717.1 hypothetical protein [Nonomuraea corallina]
MIIRLSAAVAAGLVLVSGAAHADPVKGAPELTHNELYKAAKLPKVSCGAAKGTTAASTRKYITKLVGCLNKAWKPAIADFRPVKVEFKEKDDLRACSSGMDLRESFSEICGTVIKVRLADDWIKARKDDKVLSSITRTWSGVVLGQTGIGQAWWALQSDGSEKAMKEQNRRYALQSECVQAVSVRSLGRTVKDWPAFLQVSRPKAYDRFNKNDGRTANRVYWARQGYKSGKPGACNTWKASSAKVA